MAPPHLQRVDEDVVGQDVQLLDLVSGGILRAIQAVEPREPGTTHGAGDHLAGQLDRREDHAEIGVSLDLLLAEDESVQRDGVRVVDFGGHGERQEKRRSVCSVG
jgi:hypothetical protein